MNQADPTQPVWDNHAESVSHPLRQVFMMGLVWRQAGHAKGRPLRILEIGSWCGLSALTWAEGVGRHHDSGGRITCVDPWEPYIDTKLNEGVDHQAMQADLEIGGPYENFLHNIQLIPDGVVVDHVRARSGDCLPGMPEESFDIVYVDGDHCYESVANDIRLSRPLVCEGGVLCGDDLEAQLDDVDISAWDDDPMPEFVKGPGHPEGYHPGVTRAVGEAFGRVTAWSGFWAVQKQAEAWGDISLAGMPICVPEHLPESHQYRLSRTLRRVPGILNNA